MIHTKYLSIAFLVLGIFWIWLFLTPTTVRAECTVSVSNKELQYENVDGNDIHITSEYKAIVNTVADEIYYFISASKSGCLDPLRYIFNLSYEYGSNWSLQTQTAWQSANHTTIGIKRGVRYYSAGFFADTTDDEPGIEYSSFIHFFYMQVAQTFTIQGDSNSTSSLLSGKITVPYYTQVMGPQSDGYMPTYYLLIGTDPTIRANQSADSREIQIPLSKISWSDETGSPLWRITLSINDYQVSNLEPGKTYYWRLRQQGRVTAAYIPGNAYTYTPPPPTVVTSGSSSVTLTSAKIYGRAIPNGSASIGWFRYNTRADLTTCEDSDSWGVRIPASGGYDLGSGTGYFVDFIENISGLTANQKYYYCAFASNIGGTGKGIRAEFTTPAIPSPTPVIFDMLCADGTNDQIYSTSMVGCKSSGNITFSQAASLCASNSHICSLDEYLSQGGATTPPQQSAGVLRWLSSYSNHSLFCPDSKSAVKSNSTNLGEHFITYQNISYLNACGQNAGYYYWSYDDRQSEGTVCCLNGQPATSPPPTPTPTPTPTPAPTPATGPSGSCGSGEARATDLVSTPSLTGIFPTSTCIIDPKAAFAPFKIPTYADLKSLYYIQRR